MGEAGLDWVCFGVVKGIAKQNKMAKYCRFISLVKVGRYAFPPEVMSTFMADLKLCIEFKHLPSCDLELYQSHKWTLRSDCEMFSWEVW